MIIPDKIKLSGHEIKIECVPCSQINGQGTYDNYSNLIRLECEPDIPLSNISECFLHEIVEAIKYKNQLDIPHKDLTVLSEILHHVLRGNRLVFFEEED